MTIDELAKVLSDVAEHLRDGITLDYDPQTGQHNFHSEWNYNADQLVHHALYALAEARGVPTQEQEGRVEATLSDDQILHIWDCHVNDPSVKYPLTDVDKVTFARAVLAAATVAAPAEGQPIGNRCGCNHWMKPICPERHCSWQGKRPVDAGAVTAEGQPGTAGGKEGDRG